MAVWAWAEVKSREASTFESSGDDEFGAGSALGRNGQAVGPAGEGTCRARLT
jgi:hypothetical protein